MGSSRFTLIVEGVDDELFCIRLLARGSMPVAIVEK
jgi:hypothetical protein